MQKGRVPHGNRSAECLSSRPYPWCSSWVGTGINYFNSDNPVRWHLLTCHFSPMFQWKDSIWKTWSRNWAWFSSHLDFSPTTEANGRKRWVYCAWSFKSGIHRRWPRWSQQELRIQFPLTSLSHAFGSYSGASGGPWKPLPSSNVEAWIFSALASLLRHLHHAHTAWLCER